MVFLIRVAVLRKGERLFMILAMIRSQLRVVASKFGIRNAYQLQEFTGFSPSMSYSLWRDDWKRADLKTLNTLCNLFKCTPNDLLEYKADPEETY